MERKKKQRPVRKRPQAAVIGILTPEGAASSKNHPIASGGVHIRIYCSSPLPANTVSGAARA